MASVFQEKSPPKFAPSDWHTANFLLTSTADRQRKVAHDIRQHSETTRNQTENTTRWTQHDTDTNLVFRARDINEWKKTLERTLQNAEAEISMLLLHKKWAEMAFDAKKMPLDVLMECLMLREHRVSIDLVKDEVEGELNKEFEVLQGIQNTLHQKITGAFEQLCILKDCCKQLQEDLSDKNMALNIDTTCVNTLNTTKNISFHLNPTRIEKGIVTPKQWESFSLHNNAVAESEIQRSVRMREAIDQTIIQTTSDLEAQWTATNYAFRKRVHELEQAKKELEWQEKKTQKEISDVKEEIQGLETDLAEKLPPMMVVHTRLENRTRRPNVELCRDKPQYGMVEEASRIEESIQSLKEKLEIAEQTLGTLDRTLCRIQEDLAVKTNSLNLDQQCDQVRLELSKHPKAQEIMTE